mgnify:CR=1 FL=1
MSKLYDDLKRKGGKEDIDSWVSATPGSNGSPARSLAHAMT